MNLVDNYKYRFLGDIDKDVYFNHLAFHLHKDVTKLLNIPVLKTIAEAN